MGTRDDIRNQTAEESLNYDDYLDQFITEADLTFLRSHRLTRKLIEFKYAGLSPDIMTREELIRRKTHMAKQRNSQKKPHILVGDVAPVSDDPLVQHLIKLEQRLKSGHFTMAIVYTRVRSEKTGYELGGFIDFGDAIDKCRNSIDDIDFYKIFEGRSKLMATKNSLAYFNTQSNMTSVRNSANFIVRVRTDAGGLVFIARVNERMIRASPFLNVNDPNVRMIVLDSKKHEQAIVFELDE